MTDTTARDLTDDLYLHLGVDVTRLLDLQRLMHGLLRNATSGPVIIDGDGWETWGEAPGSDANDLRTLHVIVPVRADEDQHRAMVEVLRANGLLAPMLLDHQEGVVAQVTNAADWEISTLTARLQYGALTFDFA